jgi:hypothetical protein
MLSRTHNLHVIGINAASEAAAATAFPVVVQLDAGAVRGDLRQLSVGALVEQAMHSDGGAFAPDRCVCILCGPATGPAPATGRVVNLNLREGMANDCFAGAGRLRHWGFQGARRTRAQARCSKAIGRKIAALRQPR